MLIFREAIVSFKPRNRQAGGHAPLTLPKLLFLALSTFSDMFCLSRFLLRFRSLSLPFFLPVSVSLSLSFLVGV